MPILRVAVLVRSHLRWDNARHHETTPIPRVAVLIGHIFRVTTLIMPDDGLQKALWLVMTTHSKSSQLNDLSESGKVHPHCSGYNPLDFHAEKLLCGQSSGRVTYPCFTGL